MDADFRMGIFFHPRLRSHDRTQKTNKHIYHGFVNIWARRDSNLLAYLLDTETLC